MVQPDILVTGPMPKLVMDQLDTRFTVHRFWQADDRDHLIAANADRIRGIATGGHGDVDATLIDRLPKLEIVSNFGVGYDTVDAAYAATKNIIVCNTPDVLTEEVADTAYALLLMTVRELGAAERWLRAGKWHSEGDYPLTRGSLGGKTLGIAGFGRIGKAIARRAEVSGVTVAYFGRRQQSGVGNRYYASLVEMARDVNFLLSVLPGGETTRHLVNAEVLEALGADGYFVNIGRGSTVDEAALVAALENGAIRAAGLDVFEHEPTVPARLMAMENVVLLPHVGSASIPTRNAMSQLVVDNLVSWFENGHVITPVVESPNPG